MNSGNQVHMETNSVSRRYETRRNAKAEEPVTKSRVDWRRTKRRSRLLDSEEEGDGDDLTSSSEKNPETSSGSEVDEEEKEESVLSRSKDEIVVNVDSPPVTESGGPAGAAEDTEEENINVGKHKRSRSSVMYDSEESDDSDIVRKVYAKRSCIIDEEDVPAVQEQHGSPAEAAASRKKERLVKLQELSKRRSTHNVSDGQEDTEDDVILEDSCQSPSTPVVISDSSEDDSMKDFIVDEEEEEAELEKSDEAENQRQAVSSHLLDHYIPSWRRVDHFVHFQRVVKAFLINAMDETFLISLYDGERQKKYAQEMLMALRYLDDRFIRPRLENLHSRSRWKERYKRVDSYPDVRIILGHPVTRSCQACELQRYCKFTVILSGKSYNGETLEMDDFMSHDKQALKVGIVCGDRTRVYHNLKHFKYKLYQNCCLVMKNEIFPDEPVKDAVERVFSQLDEDDWIRKQYAELQGYMEDADNFQEEKMD
ncbi:coiled-coil domain-containing protein 82 isoform X2 [Hemicordylus capensis]|uniref:coiled-coil domain-containing protein 82 isoform X2 n=1 Tax=Hemicordylus capensis TaxID=884348 RepID=UPI0023037B49|nr:coiled-coil domain-containing protein 82 isoform X2 [Hemicordylus capensis]